MSDHDPACLFCRIVAGAIPATEVSRDADVLVIRDVNPQAPEHLLVMPTKHYSDVAQFVGFASPELVAKLFSVAGQVGREQSASGFRLVVNTGPDGGQTVGHLHIHVLAGRPMGWPPG